MPEAFNINNKEIVQLTNKLEKLHRSAMPVAVRSTLNDLVFDAKQNQVEKIFEKQFIVRKKNFIRAHTIANKSKNTFNINQMQSEFGVIKGKSTAGDLLEVQETGGILSRENIPTKESRVGESPQKLVSKRYYLNRVKTRKKITGPKNPFKNQRFIRAAFSSGKGTSIQYNDILYQIRTIKKQGRNNLFIGLIPLYTNIEGTNIKLNKAPFIAPAAIASTKKTGQLFSKNADRQIKKYLG